MTTWPKALAANYEKHASLRAMRYKHYGIWHSVSWRDYYFDVKYLALGLAALGFAPQERLLIVGEPSPQWYSAELAAQALHGVAVGVPSDVSFSEVGAIISETGARIAVCEGQEQVDKLLETNSSLAKIIYWNYKGLAHYEDPVLAGYREVLELGKNSSRPERFEELLSEGKPDDPCALVYTSGTEGPPRPVPHTYRSLGAGSDTLLGIGPWDATDEIVINASPWGIIGQITLGCHLLSRCILNFAEAPETRTRDTKEIEPTIVIEEARSWESRAAGLCARMLDLDAGKRLLFRLFFDTGKKPTLLGNLVLLKALRRSLGLSRARLAYSTGGVLSPPAVRLYQAAGVAVEDLYATTESGIIAGGDSLKLLTGVRIEEGEIVAKSPGSPSEGWVKTGDAGLIEDGHLRFIDRKENGSLAPQRIEASLRFSPFIRDAWVFGRAAIIVINFPVVARWAGKKKIAFTTFAELSRAPEVYDLIKSDIDRVNADLSGAITAYLLFHRELDPDTGELTRNLTLRRKTLFARYRGIAEACAEGKTSAEADGTTLIIRGIT